MHSALVRVRAVRPGEKRFFSALTYEAKSEDVSLCFFLMGGLSTAYDSFMKWLISSYLLACSVMHKELQHIRR